MSDAIKKRQEQVELCRDLLLSNIKDNLTLFCRAIAAVIDEHNAAVRPTVRVPAVEVRKNALDLHMSIKGQVNDLIADIICDMDFAIEEEDAESS